MKKREREIRGRDRDRDMAGEGGTQTTLEYTPSWVVALVCTFIAAISFGVERLLHVLGKYLKKKKTEIS